MGSTAQNRNEQKRQRQQQRRSGSRRGGGSDPYSSMLAGHIAACAASMDGPDFKLLLHANANAVPTTSGDALVAALPVVCAKSALCIGSDRLRQGLKALTAGCYLRPHRPAVRPNAQGGAGQGRAAEWIVTHRGKSVPRTDWPDHLQAIGLAYPAWKLRISNARLRRDLRDLSGTAARALYLLLAATRTKKSGAIDDLRPIAMPASRMADLLSIPRSSAIAALRELVDRGRLIERPGTGTNHSRYLPAPATGCVSARTGKPVPHGVLQGNL